MKNESLILEHGNDELDLNKLKLNYLYSNWREVCDCLDYDYEKYKMGSRKKYLLKKISSRVEYKKGINTTIDYMFTKYKSEPVISLENMRSKNKVVKLALVNNISKHVKEHPNDYSATIVFSWDKMLKTLGMVNERYGIYKNKQDKLAEKLDVSEFVTNEFYQKSKRTLKRAVKTSLNSLQKDGAIIWYETFSIMYTDHDDNEFSLIAEDDEIKLVLEAADLAYEYIYDNFVKKPDDYHEGYYNFATKKQKAIGYMISTNNWKRFYSLRCGFLSELWNEEHVDNITITNIYKVVKIIENMYRFKKYGDILDKYDFDPYIVSPTMQDVLNNNAKRRVERVKENREIKAIGRGEIVYDYNELQKGRIQDDFSVSFWRTVKYCMEQTSSTDEVIKKMNI